MLLEFPSGKQSNRREPGDDQGDQQRIFVMLTEHWTNLYEPSLVCFWLSLVVLPWASPLFDGLLEGNKRTRPDEKPAARGGLAPLLCCLRAGLWGYWSEVLLAGFSAGLVKMVAKGPFGEILNLIIFKNAHHEPA